MVKLPLFLNAASSEPETGFAADFVCIRSPLLLRISEYPVLLLLLRAAAGCRRWRVDLCVCSHLFGFAVPRVHLAWLQRGLPPLL